MMAKGRLDPMIRDARPDDLPRLLQLVALGAVEPGDTTATPDITSHQFHWEEITASPGAVLVAEHDGDVVGVCQLIVFRHLQAGGRLCAELESVHVHPDHRGRGVGRQLVAAAVARASAAGCYRMQLTSNRLRPDAHRFYESLGFVPSHVGFKLIL